MSDAGSGAGIDTAKRTWLKAMLGVDLPEAGGSGGGATAVLAAKTAWQSAIEAVDTQITGLQSALKQNESEALKSIAEFGLGGVTRGSKVKLAAALMELGDGSPAAVKKAGPKVLAAIAGFRTIITADPRVAVVDDNPFNVAVSIKGTLGPALDGLEKALNAAA